MPENFEDASYTEYTTQVFHQRTEGIVGNPVAGPSPQLASLVRLHAPLETFRVVWTATRIGAPPVLPSSKSYYVNLNRVLIAGGRCGVITPSFGAHVYSAAGFFEYICCNPETLDSRLTIARCPWEGTAASDFYIPSESFQTGILDDSPTVPANGLGSDPDVPLILQQMIRG